MPNQLLPPATRLWLAAQKCRRGRPTVPRPVLDRVPRRGASRRAPLGCWGLGGWDTAAIPTSSLAVRPSGITHTRRGRRRGH